ncbi:hypothetical protein BDF21DRAFT_107010 [Thamnidium elegans]|nr:hypothetical protein BDF21DRAFT_107010 [Thamnidium elegans]
MSSKRFKIRKVFPQTNNVLSSLVSNSKMVALCPTITSKRSLLSTWFSVFVVVLSNPLSRLWLPSTTVRR